MKPILFAENSTIFTSNGIGRLSDAISCTVTEERNGMYELEMVYPSTGAHYEDIVIRSIIVVKPCVDANLQPFRVYQITKPIGGRVTVRAQHISYDLSKNTAMPFSVAASTAACANALQGLKTNAVEACPFIFWTDVQTIASYNQAVPASIRSRLGGVEGSILDQFHGEYEWDGFTVKLHHERGHDNGVVLRYGKNITDIKQDENIANTITGVVPFWTDYEHTQTVTLPEKAVYSANAGAYSQKLTVPLDFSSDYQEAPTVEVLRSAAQAYVNTHSLGLPKVSIDVSFVNLADTEEYKDEMAALQTVHLCDDITVQFETLGISTKAQIVKYEWDVLGEKYNNLSVGSIRSSLATTLTDQNSQMMSELKKEIVQAGQAADDATAWLTSADGYVIALKDSDGNWEAIAFSSKKNPYASDAKVILINENGIGFSTTGLNGTFSNAWTIDGHLLATFIQGGTLTLGGAGNANGTLRILNANGVQIGKWDKDGIFSSAGSLSFGSGSLLTQIKYGPSAAFGGSNALLISGNDRMAIESTAYQVRVTGNSFHGGSTDGNGYIDINNAYAAIVAQTGATITCPGYITLNSGNSAARMQLQNGVVHVTNGNFRVDGDITRNAGAITFRYVIDADEAVNLNLTGSSTNALDHLATGKFVKWSTSSDKRLKKGIKNLKSDIVRKFFDKIRPVSFKFKKDKNERTHFGLIAQELEEVFNELGLDNTDIIGELNNDEKTKFIDYPGLIGICLSAIKDLYSEVQSLKEQINAKEA